MSDIEQRALDDARELLRGMTGENFVFLSSATKPQLIDALCLAVQKANELDAAHDAFRQEVSDKVVEFKGCADSFIVPESVHEAVEALSRFIIQPKTDPLAEIIAELSPWSTSNRWNNDDFSDRLRAALKSRGLEIREVQP